MDHSGARTGAGRSALGSVAVVRRALPLRAGHVAAAGRRQAVHELLHVLPCIRQRVAACGSVQLHVLLQFGAALADDAIRWRCCAVP